MRYSSAVVEKSSFGVYWVSAIGEVLNTSSFDLYLSEGTIDLLDSNVLVTTLEYVSVYPQVIAPGEKAYYYQTAHLPEVTSVIELDAILNVVAKESKIENIRLDLNNIVIHEDDYVGVSVTGNIINNTNEDELNVGIAVVLFDKNKKPIAVMTDFKSLLAEESTTFMTRSLYTSDLVTKESIGSYLGYAFPYRYQI